MSDANRILDDRPLAGESAYVYGLKRRAQEHHCLGYGTFRIDLSTAARARKRYSRALRPITYRPIYVKALARTLVRHPEANAILFKRALGLFGLRRIVRFERVDVNLPVTRELDGHTVTLIATVRDAARKTLAEIQDELTEVEKGDPATLPSVERFRKLAHLPPLVIRLVHWLLTVSPRFYVKSVGTCGLTFLEGNWYDDFFPIGPTSVVFSIGAAREEPVVVEGAIEVRRLQHCVVSVDNYVVSGPIGLEVARHFRELVESGALVDEELGPESPQHESGAHAPGEETPCASD